MGKPCNRNDSTNINGACQTLPIGDMLATKAPAKPEGDAGRLVQWRLNSDRVILGTMNGDVQKKGIEFQ